ncbi:hypothetical protein Nepgr_031711 [Nepenthes gracilis]|uniref:Uncharacterized protein n=1 Tax=Nepenthes gracilis TaxID=150966 RepID=A0AAD3TH90_NEPGR|nr:hypothetical protein Nepgr_031711 [Nepenthes gracilis]
MGNCLFGGAAGGGEPLVKVVTSNGGIMEFEPPISAGCIIEEFSGHSIYRGDDLLWKPLGPQELLHAGETYYLLPSGRAGGWGRHVRSKSTPMTSLPMVATAPYRMSGVQRHSLRRSYSKSDNDSISMGGGVWKVKLVISSDQLIEILSEATLTQELIESVRAVAKCGSYAAVGFSDHWSISGGSTASSN